MRPFEPHCLTVWPWSMAFMIEKRGPWWDGTCLGVHYSIRIIYLPGASAARRGVASCVPSNAVPVRIFADLRLSRSDGTRTVSVRKKVLSTGHWMWSKLRPLWSWDLCGCLWWGSCSRFGCQDRCWWAIDSATVVDVMRLALHDRRCEPPPRELRDNNTRLSRVTEDNAQDASALPAWINFGAISRRGLN